MNSDSNDRFFVLILMVYRDEPGHQPNFIRINFTYLKRVQYSSSYISCLVVSSAWFILLHVDGQLFFYSVIRDY